MRVLITGGAGFIGSHIVDRMLGDGHTVLVVDDLSTGRQSNLAGSPGADLVQLDMGTAAFIDLARAFRPDAISHVAAQPSVAVSMKQPEHDARTNIVAGLNVYRAALESECPRFIYITTGGALYGPPDYLPCDEDHPIRPESAYALSKWTLERYLSMLMPPEVSVRVLRLANIYGPRQDPHGEAGVVAIFAERMVRRLPVEIFGDGQQTRDFVFVQDVAEAHALALESDRRFTVNISTGQPLSVNELFAAMARESGYELPAIHKPERRGDLKDSVLDNRRAAEVLGWRPRTAVADGIRTTIEWARMVEANSPALA